MSKIMRSIVYLNEEERQKAIALSEEMKMSISALFRSVLNGKLPKTPTPLKIKIVLRLGDAINRIEGMMEKIPRSEQEKFKELSELLEEVQGEIAGICQ